MVAESAPLKLARRWMKAIDERDPNAAADLVSDDCRITNPTGGDDFVGPSGVRELLRMAPPTLKRTTRTERVQGTTVHVEGLARIPGLMANFTTWRFETDGEHITRVTFALRPAN